jgi:S-DNA-T family DNA segregation ATPase FtsK/SpoIIIE
METAKLRRLLVGLALVAVGVFLAASLLSHNSHEGPFPDSPPAEHVTNLCGVAGAYLSAYALAAFGWTSLAAAVSIIIIGGFVLSDRKPDGWPFKLGGIALAFVALMILLSLPHASPTGVPRGSWGVKGFSSGIVGMFLTNWLYHQTGLAGTLTVMLFCAVVSVYLAGGALMPVAVSAAGRVAAWIKAKLPRRAQKPFAAEGTKPTVSPIVVTPIPRREPEILPHRPARPAPAVNAGPQSSDEKNPGPQPAPQVPADQKPEAKPVPKPPSKPEPAPAVAAATEPAPLRADQPPKREPEIIVRPKDKRTRSAADPIRANTADGQFRLPPIDILDPPSADMVEADEEEIRQKGHTLEQTLKEFKIEAQVVRVQRGPVITMYEMALAAGTKVSKVEALSDDLAIALRAPNVRVVAPLPGRNTVGIEVPNSQREVVCLRELLETMDRKVAKMAIPLFLGKDTAGAPLIVDLAMAPHLMLAGATGSGKSVAINTIIGSILLTRTPNEVQLLLIDPKSVEFSDYQGLPHLICPIVTDMKKAAAVLEWACKKMDERYATLARVSVRNIAAYNQLGEKEIIRRLNPEEDADIDDVPFHMPHVVIVIDELGELMLVAAKEVEHSITRLSQKARAVGIHLICATQRPSTDVITGLIKANLPVRVAFQVSSMVDSRTILDRNGAEKLLGRGDMLILPPGSSRLVRAQGTFMTQEETNRLVEFWTKQGEPHYREELREFSGDVEAMTEGDEMFEEAARIVMETQRGSVSLLQRRLSIGYSRAARLIDMMAEAGIVGSYRGSQARDVLMTIDEWEAARQKKAS